MDKFLNSIGTRYTMYFNRRHKRVGRLYQDVYKAVLVSSDEQLLHLTRYIHLNPVSVGLAFKPEYWTYSSYKEYLSYKKKDTDICSFRDVIDIEPKNYKTFVEERINDQKLLSKIKSGEDGSYGG